MTTPMDRIPEFQLGPEGSPRREPIKSGDGGASHALDAETLEVVQKFEALYAEFSSATQAPAQPEEDLRADDLLIDLPEDLVHVRGAPLRGGSKAPARAAAAAPPVDSAPPATEGARPRLPKEEHALDIDEAFAMLRTAEARGRANAERDAVDREDEVPAAAGESARERLRPLKWTNDRRPAPVADDVPTAGVHRAVGARAMWLKVAGAAAIALIAGGGAGYIAGGATKTTELEAKIPVTPQGGAQLRFDYDLGKRQQ